MFAVATITSKRQLTIPVKVFKRAGLKQNQKVVVAEDRGTITVQAARAVVEELAGSIKIPARFRGMTIDKIIEVAKREYFSKSRI